MLYFVWPNLVRRFAWKLVATWYARDQMQCDSPRPADANPLAYSNHAELIENLICIFRLGREDVFLVVRFWPGTRC